MKLKSKYSGRNLPTKNLIWPDLGSKPCVRAARSATDRLSHGAAHLIHRGTKEHYLGRMVPRLVPLVLLVVAVVVVVVWK